MNQFEQDKKANIAAMAADHNLQKTARELFNGANAHRYSYHFTWMGRPIIKYPQDVLAMQELIGTGGVVLPGVQT